MIFRRHPEQKSILVLGASGRTGLECIRKLCSHDSKPQVHAFCRDDSKLSFYDKALCASVIEADARSENDIARALEESQADFVIVSIGNGDCVGKTDLRAVSGFALATVMKQSRFSHVKAVIVSSVGASNSKIIFGLGIGAAISYHLRHVLDDHTRQEFAFSDLMDRTVIVRATALTNEKAISKLVVSGDEERSPTIKTDRADLALWIAEEICEKGEFCGRAINVTGQRI